MAQSQGTQYRVISSLKFNNKGWNIQLFEDQIKLSAHICTKCKSVCCDPVELGCNHNDDDIYLYCDCCLRDLIEQNDSKCPINSHIDPVIIPSRASKRQILKATVFCPYSTAYKTAHNELINNNNNQIIDTLGGDEKEGASSQLNQNEIHVNRGCSWKGTLTDLINKHITECTKKNNPTYTLTIQIEKLRNENKTLNEQIVLLNIELHKHIQNEHIVKELNQTIARLTNEIILKDETINTLETNNDNLKDSINEKNVIIANKQNRIDEEQKVNIQLQNEMKLMKQENEELTVQLNEQFKLMQDVMTNVNNHVEHDEKKNNDVESITSKCKQTDFKFIVPKNNQKRFTKIGNVIIKYIGTLGYTREYYSCWFGPELNDNDKITVQFEIQKKGDESNYGFGFDTASRAYFAVIGNSTYQMSDEFKKINDENAIKQMLTNIKFLENATSTIFMSVDMKEMKGWIWSDCTGDNNKFEVNLPDATQIYLTFSGTDDKIVCAKSIIIQ